MKITGLTLLLLVLISNINVIAQAFTETFDTNPCGTAFCRVTSFSVTHSSVQFDITFTGGEFFHESQYGDGNSASINSTSDPYDLGTTETIVIKRNDDGDFIFNSIYINNSGGRTVTIQGYNNGSTVGSSQTVAMTDKNTYSFGGITVDEVRLTSIDFSNTNFDSFSGEIPASTPDISIDDLLNITESSSTVNFTVSLSASSASTVTVDYATANGTASAGSDYTFTTGTVTFTPGQTSRTINVDISEDLLYENNESFYINLSNPVNANIADNQGEGRIINNDSPPSVTLDPSVLSKAEGAGSMYVVCELSAASGLSTTINFIYSGTATSGVDYTAFSSLVIAAGDTRDSIPIYMTDDDIDEGDETVIVEISSVFNGTESGGFQMATYTIEDDDETPVVTPGQSFSLNENSTAATVAGTVAATDSDASTTLQNWTITTNTNPDGDGNNAFSINSNTGQVTVNDPGDLNYEWNTSLIIQVTVSDGTNTSSAENVTINLNDLDDTSPTITANTGVTLDEGATETINNTELQANDTDTNNDNLTYSITTAPSNGQLELTTGPGTPISSFTQAQLNANQVVYIHDHGNSTSDSFGFDVQDGSGNNLTGQTFSITINPIDDTAPTLATNTGITVNEGASEIINATELEADDTDTDNNNLTFSVTTGPTNGQLELTTGPGVAITSFTQAQINANQVVYVHDDSNTTSDSFTFDVQDGSGNNLPGQTFSITINPIDDDTPSMDANTGITLGEGATKTILSTELKATDPDTDDNTLTFVVTAAPVKGQLEHTTAPGTPITSFTQAQVNVNQVVYVHDDSNSTSDNLTFDVQDGNGNNLTGQNFSITINPVDDDVPSMDVNTGITLDEGGTKTILSTELKASDPDTDDNALTFVVTAAPINGQLELTTAPGTPITSFTQAQVNANQVVYVHDDSNTPSDNLTFDVQDGNGNNLTGQAFSITINPVDDDAPTITANTGITLDEGATEIIDSNELQADDADTDNDNLTYSVTASPASGQLELTTGPGTGITSFTQAHLNANEVVYIHNNSNTTSDSFTFDVQDGSGNNLTGQTFSITINPVDDDTPIMTVNTGSTLDEGAPETINSSELQADDTDTDNDNLTYAVTAGPANGQLELTNDAGVAITSFNQAQLNANEVVYVHDHSNTTSDSFDFDVQDGSGNNLTGQTFSITINPVDDDTPTITANTGITLDEGATEIIDSNELQADDADTDNDNLRYSVTAGPTNGQLELTTGTGNAITSFTQAQLNSNEVVYIHNNSNTTSDSFDFDVQDGSGNNLTGHTFSITINSVDDDTPTITVNTGITLDEGATEAINNSELHANDTDTDNDNLTYSVTAGPANGQLELTTGAGVVITSFSQAQLNSNEVVYVHDDSNTTSDSFDFDVQDGSGNNLTGQNFSITINPVDDDTPTIIANNGITLDEGATEVINSTELQSDDADTNNDNLTYAVTAGPLNGQLELTTGAGVAITSFTQAQLNADQVIYVHDDSNTTSDSFDFDVQDGSGNNLTGQTFNININPIDDDTPTITANTGITLDEGATEVINSTELQADDTDTDNNNLTYAVTMAPANGQLELITGAGITITSFTQAQLNANQIVYVHDDSNTTSDSFTFDVQDGSGNNLIGQTFSITINSVNDDSPTITANTGITLDEGATEIIDSNELQADDTDTNSDNLTYSVTANPSNGQLELTTGAGIVITSFTQAQLNANEVVYVHNNSNTTSDSFTFDVQDGSGNNLVAQTLSITISSVDDDSPTITANTGITLDEGATKTLNSSVLQSDDADTDNNSLTYSVTAGPANGQLELTTGAGVAITSFTQAQLNANEVVYVHDHSNTTSDSFTFDVQDGSGNNLTGQTFSISINSVDDDSPTMTVNTGITLDEGATEIIDSNELQADDADTDNDNLRYSVTTGPSNGQLELTTGTGIAITSFTQAQLNANEVVYIHDHSNTTSDSFIFDVQDGSGNNLTGQNFSITINPLDDDTPTITVNTGITLDEGATEIIDSNELQTDDADTDNDNLRYAVTAGPANGQLELSTGAGVAVTSFTQAQLNANEVVYIHDDSNTTSDSFDFDVQDGSGNNLTGQTFSITVNPVDDDAPTITVNTGIILDEGATEIIDSNELQAEDTDTDNDNLTYAVTASPANGQLELTTGPGTGITSFTQAQLNANEVVYVHDDNNTSSDNFTFDVQDGSGNNLTGQTFSITINSVDDDTPTITVNTGITLDEGATETINSSELQADDTDTDNDNLTYAVTTGPSNGQLELTTDAGVAITSFTQAQLNANEVVYVHDHSNTTSDSFIFDVQDGSGNNLTGQTFSITINPVDDDAPVATADDYEVNEDEVLSVPSPGVLENDSDTESKITAIVEKSPANGALSLNSDGSFTYTPNSDYFGDDSFTYKAFDGKNESNETTVNLTIKPINDHPTLSELSDMEMEVNTVSDPVTVEISDIDNAIETLTVTASSSNAALIPESNINISGSGGSRSITFEPLEDAIGDAIISVTVSDGELETTNSFTLSVVVMNSTPSDLYISSNEIIETIDLNEVIGVFSTEDIDLEDTYTYALVDGEGDNDNVYFTIQGDQLLANHSFDYDVQQQFTIRVRSTDDRKASVEKVFTLSLLPDADLEPLIYNGFTPNDDGVNDTWEIDNILIYPNIEVKIYNRYGQEIFLSKGYNQPWDGTFNGESLPLGSYYYIIKLNDGTGRTFKGTVTILK